MSHLLTNGAIFTIVAASLAVLLSQVFRKQPGPRAALLVGTLAAIAVWPVFVVLGSKLSLGQVRMSTEIAAPVPRVEPPAQTLFQAGVNRPVQREMAVPSAPAKPVPWDQIALGVWLAGSLFQLAVYGRDLRRARAVAKRAIDLDGEEAATLVQVVSERHFPYRVRISDEIGSPAALALDGGLILLPRGQNAWTRETLEAVLLHEVAHLKGRHALWTWVRLMAEAAAWWNPLVHLAGREAEQALEELCDESTARVQRTGLPLARMLVAFSTSSAGSLRPPALTMLSAGEKIERRLRRLMNQGEQLMTQSNRFAATGAALLSLVAVSAAVALTSSPQQGFDYASFGLSDGTKWTYRYTSGARSEVVTKEVTGKVDAEGKPVAEIKVSRGPTDYTWEYLGSDPEGLRSYQQRYLNNWPGVAEGYPALLWFKADVKEGDTWTWTRIVPVQTMGNAKYSPDDFRENVTATVEAVDKPVETKAGTFKVFVIRYDADAHKLGKSVTRRWISPTAGIVREERKCERSSELWELVGFKPASKSLSN